MLQSIKSTNVSQTYYIFIIDKMSLPPYAMASRAGFGPRDVVWRPLF